VGPPKVAKADVIHEKYTGKFVSDGLASDIKCKLNSSVKGGYCSLPGFRNHLMYLAQKFPKTKGDPANKTGMWSPSRIIYGYYRASLFGKKRHFNKFPQSKLYKFRVGLSQDAARVATQGPLKVREFFCACPSCAPPKYDFVNCQFKGLMGRALDRHCPPLAHISGVATQSMQLAAFAGTLKQGQVRAVNVASDERDSEGTFWLCNLLGDAYQLLEAMTCMDENYEAGFWVVRVQWYEFCGETNLGERKYKLSAGERTLGANAIKRIDPIELAKTDPATVTVVAVAAPRPILTCCPKVKSTGSNAARSIACF